MKPTVITKRQSTGQLVLMIIQEDLSYDAIEELAEFFESEYGAEVLEKIDGPYSRRWFVKIDGQKIAIDFDESDGFDLTGESQGAEDLLLRISDDLIRRFPEI